MQNSKGEKIVLYVDDEEKNLSSFKAVFKKEYKIYVARSAEEGIELLEQNPVHLVISDQRMPNMTGVELLEKIAEKHPDITRIILTGYSDLDAIVQAINKGRVFKYITKPWKKEELKHTIDNAIDAFQLKQQNHQLIQKLKKANEELDSFVYSAAHDLRAPVASLLGLINLAQNEKDIQKIKEYLSLQEKTITKLDSFIHKIINYSKNARLKIERKSINFKTLIPSVLEHYRYYENANKIDMQLDIQQKSPFSSDYFRLEIIFNNLVSNAIRFCNPYLENSFLHIKVHTTPKKAEIQMIDNGQGIAKKHLPKIFDMFYRATDQKAGSGLGLFLVKETVEKLEGKIKVSSEIGLGTTFSIEIPNLKGKSSGE